MRRSYPIIAFLLLLQSTGCSPSTDDHVVARVDTEKIALEDLRRFKADMSALQLSEEGGIEGLLDYLQSMVDMKLMLLEARARGMDQAPEFVRNWSEAREKRLVAEYLQRRLKKKIDLSQEEWAQRFKGSKWSRMLKLAHIRVGIGADARQAVQDLEQGRGFEEVAREWSTDKKTASRGGVLDTFFGRGNLEELGLPVEIADEVFDLQVGAFSRPFEIEGGYEIFKVVDERPAPATYAISFVRTMITTAFHTRRKELLAELAEKFDVRLDEDAIAFLVEKASGDGEGVLQLSEQERVLCRFNGGQLTLKDFVGAQARASYPVRFDSSGIVEFIDQFLLPGPLLYRAALQEGLEQDSSMAAWLTAKKEALLIEALKVREVDEQIDLSEAAVRRYYETHLDQFSQPEEIQLLEILVKSQEEANNLLQRIRNGEDMESLAVRYSIREGARDNSGRFHIRLYERRRFGALLDEATKAEAGKVNGPVEVEEGYSVFKVLKRVGPKPQAFEKAARKAQYGLKKQEEKRLLDALFLKLREKYASEIVLFEDRLKMMDEESGP